MNKLDKLRKQMHMHNIDGYILVSKELIGYITGIFSEDAYLAVTKDKCMYVTDDRYIIDVRNKIGKDKIDVVNLDEKEKIKDYFNGNVYIEENKVTIYKKEFLKKIFNLHDINNGDIYLNDLRIIKDEDEIEKIKSACKITDSCFKYIKEYIKEGMTEKQIKAEINKYYEIHADGFAFETIVAFSENAAIPHAVSSDRKLKDGDIILIDMGAKLNGYVSDMTRCILFGNVSDKVKDVYNKVLKIQRECINAISINSRGKDINEIYVNNLERYGYNVLHSLGHGLGVYIHKLPFVSKICDIKLEENMVITIEPGIYIENEFGIRIEDTVLIKKDRVITLTNSEK